ncbi:MAG: HEPN domain-containing protein [Muribaculaceae bacterium]|nr:HEPN domain-containing protein [Muribaculaceae bacterium]
MTLSSTDREAIISYRLERAKNTFAELRYVIKGGYWNLAANRLYYSAFYACIALLLKNQIVTTSHAGVNRMMNLHFIQTGILSEEEGKLLKRLFRMRQTGDYDDLMDWDEEDVLPYIPKVENLLSRISELINERVESGE